MHYESVVHTRYSIANSLEFRRVEFPSNNQNSSDTNRLYTYTHSFPIETVLSAKSMLSWDYKTQQFFIIYASVHRRKIENPKGVYMKSCFPLSLQSIPKHTSFDNLFRVQQAIHFLAHIFQNIFDVMIF